mgnify:CR=1 FL=1
MDAILRLAKKYSKKKHTNILPCCDVNILENLHFLYDEDWENQSTYPYEILTYLLLLCFVAKTRFGIIILLAGD